MRGLQGNPLDNVSSSVRQCANEDGFLEEQEGGFNFGLCSIRMLNLEDRVLCLNRIKNEGAYSTFEVTRLTL